MEFQWPGDVWRESNSVAERAKKQVAEMKVLPHRGAGKSLLDLQEPPNTDASCRQSLSDPSVETPSGPVADSLTGSACAFHGQLALACSGLANTARTSGGSGFLSREGLRAWHRVGCRPSQVRDALLNHLLKGRKGGR